MARKLRLLCSRLLKHHRKNTATQNSTPEKSSRVPVLPPEVLTNIFLFLNRYRDLKNVALCSRQFHEIVLPVLYSNIDLLDNEDLVEHDAAENIIIPAEFEHLRELVRLLTAKPEYAQHVKRLTLRGSLDPRYRQPGEKEQKFSKERTRVGPEVSAAIKKYSYGDMDVQLSWNLEAGSRVWGVEPLVTVLLLILPNLETFDFCSVRPPLAKGAVISESELKHQGTALAKLRDVVFTSSHPSHSSPATIADWLLLPSIQRLFVHRVSSRGNLPRETDEQEEAAIDDGDAKSDDRDPDLPNRFLRRVTRRRNFIEHMEFKACSLNNADLFNLLKAPTALKTFTYESFVVYRGFEVNRFKDFLAFRTALSAQARSLENLWLDYNLAQHDTPASNLTAMDSLADFPRLRHVRIPLLCLYGPAFGGENVEQPGLTSPSRLIRFLPPNIERFRLTHCEHECNRIYFEQAMIELLQHLYNIRLNRGELTTEAREEYEDQHRFSKLHEITLEADENTFSLISPELCSLLDDIPGLEIICLDNSRFKEEEIQPRKWGMDEEISWAKCHHEVGRPVFPRVNVKSLVEKRALHGDVWRRPPVKRSLTGGLSIVETNGRNGEEPGIRRLTQNNRSNTVWK